jgi:hypothetical protein
VLHHCGSWPQAWVLVVESGQLVLGMGRAGVGGGEKFGEVVESGGSGVDDSVPVVPKQQLVPEPVRDLVHQVAGDEALTPDSESGRTPYVVVELPAAIAMPDLGGGDERGSRARRHVAGVEPVPVAVRQLGVCPHPAAAVPVVGHHVVVMEAGCEVAGEADPAPGRNAVLAQGPEDELP